MTFRTNPGTWKLVCFGCVRTLKSPKMEQYRRKLPKIASYAAGNFRNTLGCKPGSQHDLKNALVPAQSLTRGEMLAAKLVRPWTDAEKKVFHDKVGFHACVSCSLILPRAATNDVCDKTPSAIGDLTTCCYRRVVHTTSSRASARTSSASPPLSTAAPPPTAWSTTTSARKPRTGSEVGPGR